MDTVTITFQQIKKELDLTDAKMAEIFRFKNASSYSHSSAKQRYEEAVVKLYEIIKSK